jgi:DNA helicase IV
MSDVVRLYRAFDHLLANAKHRDGDLRKAFSSVLVFLRSKPRGINTPADNARLIRRLCKTQECQSPELRALIFDADPSKKTALEFESSVDALVHWYNSQSAKIAEVERREKQMARLKEVSLLLARFRFDEADRLYQKSTEEISESVYKALKEKAQERHFDLETKSKTSEVTDLLIAFRFDDAEKFFKENERYIDQSVYEIERAKQLNQYQEKIEKERQRQQEELRKQEYVQSLHKTFESKFLDADAFQKEHGSGYLTEPEYDETKTQFVRNWLSTQGHGELDAEQAAAVAAVNGNIQLVARAGSGKTRTLVARAVFLQTHCGVSADQILILAFNRKAAKEVKKRLEKVLPGNIPHVMTFHALAHALVHPENRLLYDDFKSQEFSLSRAVQQIVDDHLRDHQVQDELRLMMLSHFRGDWERIVTGGHTKQKDEFLEFRRSLSGQSLRGETVKSFGEKAIADFLFEHDVPYHYERNLWWKERNYRPDFTLPVQNSKGLIIEYFGMTGDSEYDQQAEEKRRFWSQDPKWDLVEIFPKDIKAGRATFWNHLLQLLEEKGISCQRLAEEELWERLRGRAIDRFSMACSSFIGRCRKSLMTPEALAKSIAGHSPTSEAEERFLANALRIYSAYMDMLKAAGDDDFDGLMQSAIGKINCGDTCFGRKESSGDLNDLRYLLIDEFQDFSLLFQQTIDAVRNGNSALQCFCVGDDWQAINRFAGSDLKFFDQFSENFEDTLRLNLSTNYRSARSIIHISNEVMEGHGQPASGSRPDVGQVLYVDARDFKPTPPEKEEHKGDVITPIVLRLVKDFLKSDKNVVLLSRKNMLAWYVHYDRKLPSSKGTLDSYLDLIRSYILPEHRKRVSISTTHGYKGEECAHVIVLDAVDRSYPLVHPDWIFSRIFGEDEDTLIEEERRLFYVALSRAEDRLVVISDGGRESPFFTPIRKNTNIESVDWERFPYNPGGGRTVVRVYNQRLSDSNATYRIKDDLKASGYQWQSTKPVGWVKTFDPAHFSIDLLRSEPWAGWAPGVEIEILLGDTTVSVYQWDEGEWPRKEP